MKFATEDPRVPDVSGGAGGVPASRRVLRYIAAHGRATATELATAFGVTPAAVRRHLSALVSEGQVEARTGVRRPSGAGRPATAYIVTSRGREGLDSAYDELAISALEALRAVGGDAAVNHFFAARFADVESRCEAILEHDPTLDPAEALARALTELGFMTALTPARAGEQLCQHHCPYPVVAERFPELCAAETAVFSRVLNSHLQRLATIAHGDGVCTTHIPKRGH